MTMPGDIAIIDTLMGIPRGPDDTAWRTMLAAQLRDKESKETFRFPAEYMYKDLPDRAPRRPAPTRSIAEMDRWGVRARPDQRVVRRSEYARRRAAASTPTASSARYQVDPNQGMDGVRDLVQAVRGARHQGGQRVPGRVHAAGADQRQALLPDLRQVRRARHPDLRLRRRARARGCRWRCQKVELHRRGVLVLPRAQVRDAPRLPSRGTTSP